MALLQFSVDEDDLPSSGGGAAQPDPLDRPQTQWDPPADDDRDPHVYRLPENIERSARYHERTPEPNYSQFKAEYIDSKGREYALARAGNFLEGNAGLDNGKFDTPPREGSVKAKRLLMFLRMPINQRWSVPIPDPDGEKLQLYHVATQVLCKSTTDGVFVSGPRARTGYIYMRDFESLGQVADPSPFEPWLRLGKEPGKKWF